MARCICCSNEEEIIGAIIFAPKPRNEQYFALVDFRIDLQVRMEIAEYGAFDPIKRLSFVKRKRKLALELPNSNGRQAACVFARVSIGELVCLYVIVH